MAEIKAADVAKLRAITGAGMMDCKQALTEANGDINQAIDILRKKGQKVANKRADRDASEGVAIAKTTDDKRFGALIVINCETDFVAKNDNFVKLAYSILEIALLKKPATIEELKGLKVSNYTVQEEIMNETGRTGEKMELSYYQTIQAPLVTTYIHPGNKVASMAGFNKETVTEQICKDIVMQIAAMPSVALDKNDVSDEIIKREIEIGKEQAINEGKTPEMAEKIAVGKLNKFYQESTLLNQEFIKDNKKSVRQYLQDFDKSLTVTAFKRFSLSL